jgi:hypothetical protein
MFANLATWNEPALRELLNGAGIARVRWSAMHDETNAPPDIPKRVPRSAFQRRQQQARAMRCVWVAGKQS